jgi:hypothetical protein
MSRVIEVECRVLQECYFGNPGEDKRRLSPDKRGRNRAIYKGPENKIPRYLEPIGQVKVLSDDTAKLPVPKRRTSHSEDTLAAENKEARIRAALEQLDPENASHWTKGGDAAMEAIEGLGGFKPKEVTRSEVQNAWPELSRDFMREYIPASGKR